MNENRQDQTKPHRKRNRDKHIASQQQRSNVAEDELSLNSVNLLLERKVDDGVKELRKRFWPYTIILLLGGGVGIFGLFKGITADIRERLTSAYVADTLNEHISKFTDGKVAKVADGRISIAEDRIIKGFEKKVAEQKSMLAKSSSDAEAQIRSLRSSLDVMKKAYDARGGNRQAFDEISILATNKTDAGEIAAKVIREIEASYAARKERERIGFMGTIRPTVTYNGSTGKRGPISLADASMLVMAHNRDLEEGSINRLADSGQKEFVDILMQSIAESDRLGTVYVALRGIEKLTGVSFPALGISEANKWWELNKDNPEYHSPYKTVWTMLLHNQLQIQPKESTPDYYKRVIVPLHAAIVAKSGLEDVAKVTLPLAFAFGRELKIDGIDCLAINKDLISHLGNDADSRRMAFRYTMNTMLLYEHATAGTLANFIVRSIRANPDFLAEFKTQKAFTSEFKDLIESTLKTLEEHTKGIPFICVMNSLRNGETQFKTQITSDSEVLHDLDLLVRKDSTFVIRSANDIEVPSGEVGVINFKTNRKEGRILLLNERGIPHLFDVQITKEISDPQPVSGER